ncbi:phosphocholine cytidylyltransferase family protein [bacterium]|jgi:L-glutamine-phosphate cytidylyltransferase|nr:phosphocholine cytidylyltransferase family protein [bacterium]
MESRKPKVILLVAGEGKRLRPYTLDRPKCMVEIDGISLIDRQLSVLESEGLSDIVMIGGYKAEMLKGKNAKLKLNPRYYETNMVWTLFSAEEELAGDIIVSYGDIVYSREILQELLKSTADIAVIVDKEWEEYWRSRDENLLDDAETLKLKADGTISEIGQKPKSLNEIEGQYIGLMKFSAKGISQIKKVFYTAVGNGELFGNPVEESYMTDLLQSAITSGIRVTSVPIYDKWIEIDTIRDLKSGVASKRLEKITL